MRPIAIFRHLDIEGPGYLSDFLDARRIPWELIAIDAGMTPPDSPEAYSGLVFMGGPMSVNDDLPWIPASLALIRQAVARDIPVLGHCLGGQIMAKALGGSVARNPVKEIGWHEVSVDATPEAEAWFGATRRFTAYHWHGETFSLPKGAIRLLSSAHCANQAFTLGKHLALQCHVEMTAPMIQAWSLAGQAEIAANPGPTVQDEEAMVTLSSRHLPGMMHVAEHLYSRWIKGLA